MNATYEEVYQALCRVCHELRGGWSEEDCEILEDSNYVVQLAMHDAKREGSPQEVIDVLDGAYGKWALGLVNTALLLLDTEVSWVMCAIPEDEPEPEDYEDDCQPDSYTEWQDYMGGDDWDHGQFDDPCDSNWID